MLCVLYGCECGFCSVTNTLGFMFLACSNTPQCIGDLLCFVHFVSIFQLTVVRMNVQGCLKALSHTQQTLRWHKLKKKKEFICFVQSARLTACSKA